MNFVILNGPLFFLLEDYIDVHCTIAYASIFWQQYTETLTIHPAVPTSFVKR